MSKKEDLTGGSRIVSNVITGWLSYLVFFVAGFFLPRLIDDKLGQFSLGVWDFSWSFVNYIKLASLGIGSSLNRYVAKWRAESRLDMLERAVSTSVVLQFIISILVLLATGVVTAFISLQFESRFGDQLEMVEYVVFFLGMSVVFQFMFDTSRGVLTGCHRWDLFNALNSAGYILTVFFMIGSLYLGYGLIALSVIYMVFTLFTGIARSFVALKVCPEAKFRFHSFSWEFVKEILPFGLKAIIIGISPLLIIQSTYILVAWMLGPAALAVLARPMALVKHIETFITRFTFVLTPMAGSIQTMKGSKELKDFTLACGKYGFAFTFPAMILFAFYGPEIVGLWMGSDYVHPELMYMLAGGFLLPIAQSPIIRILIGLDAHGSAAKRSMYLTVIFYVMILPIIYLFGPTLENFALLISLTTCLVNGIALPYGACRDMGISLSEYVVNVFAIPGAIGLSGFVVLYLLNDFAGGSIAYMLGNTLVFAVFIVTLYWIFLFPDAAKDKLVKKLRMSI